MLDAIKKTASEESWAVLRLDGSTEAGSRMQRIEAWDSNSIYSVFLLAKDAGAAGISLTSASWLVVYEPSWNPTSDVQACGRIWRPGQPRACRILRRIGQETFEEKILLRQYLKHGCWPLVYPAVSSADEPLASLTSIRGLMTPVLTTHEPPSRGLRSLSSGCFKRALLFGVACITYL